jgi:hypothetical protein
MTDYIFPFIFARLALFISTQQISGHSSTFDDAPDSRRTEKISQKQIRQQIENR